MTDNVALSFIILFIEGMAQIIDQNTENDVQESSAPSDSTVEFCDVSAVITGGLMLPTIAGSVDRSLPSLSGNGLCFAIFECNAYLGKAC